MGMEHSATPDASLQGEGWAHSGSKSGLRGVQPFPLDEPEFSHPRRNVHPATRDVAHINIPAFAKTLAATTSVGARLWRSFRPSRLSVHDRCGESGCLIVRGELCVLCPQPETIFGPQRGAIGRTSDRLVMFRRKSSARRCRQHLRADLFWCRNENAHPQVMTSGAHPKPNFQCDSDSSFRARAATALRRRTPVAHFALSLRYQLNVK
jgi:hypothetical protein